MPTVSKFTVEARTRVIEALQVGASRTTAAAIGRIGESTLRRWMEQGKNAAAGSRYAQFREDVLAAEAHPKMRALGIVYQAMEDKPDIAWKYIERRESGFAPPMPVAPTSQAAPVMIHLSFHDGGALSAATVQSFIEGEVVEQDEPAETPALPAEGQSA